MKTFYALIRFRGKEYQVGYDPETGKAYWMDEEFQNTGWEVRSKFEFIKYLETSELDKEKI